MWGTHARHAARTGALTRPFLAERLRNPLPPGALTSARLRPTPPPPLLRSTTHRVGHAELDDVGAHLVQLLQRRHRGGGVGVAGHQERDKGGAVAGVCAVVLLAGACQAGNSQVQAVAARAACACALLAQHVRVLGTAPAAPPAPGAPALLLELGHAAADAGAAHRRAHGEGEHRWPRCPLLLLPLAASPKGQGLLPGEAAMVRRRRLLCPRLMGCGVLRLPEGCSEAQLHGRRAGSEGELKRAGSWQFCGNGRSQCATALQVGRWGWQRTGSRLECQEALG